MLRWNNTLWLDVASHMSIFTNYSGLFQHKVVMIRWKLGMTLAPAVQWSFPLRRVVSSGCSKRSFIVCVPRWRSNWGRRKKTLTFCCPAYLPPDPTFRESRSTSTWTWTGATPTMTSSASCRPWPARCSTPSDATTWSSSPRSSREAWTGVFGPADRYPHHTRTWSVPWIINHRCYVSSSNDICPNDVSPNGLFMCSLFVHLQQCKSRAGALV